MFPYYLMFRFGFSVKFRYLGFVLVSLCTHCQLQAKVCELSIGQPLSLACQGKKCG